MTSRSLRQPEVSVLLATKVAFVVREIYVDCHGPVGPPIPLKACLLCLSMH